MGELEADVMQMDDILNCEQCGKQSSAMSMQRDHSETTPLIG